MSAKMDENIGDRGGCKPFNCTDLGKIPWLSAFETFDHFVREAADSLEFKTFRHFQPIVMIDSLGRCFLLLDIATV